MPAPMQVRMFMDSKPSELEKEINAWLDYLGSATVVKMETKVTAVEEKGITYPCIVVTVWYEPPEAN
jgi:hypothetical protein